VTSVQSSLTGCATPVASWAGETSEGAAGVAGFTVSVALRVAPYEPEIVTDVEDGTL
jgi:hypothetical protein